VLTDKNTKKRKVITPALEDLVLPGVTRDSIIVLFLIILATFAPQRNLSGGKSHYGRLNDKSFEKWQYYRDICLRDSCYRQPS
jgi:hypothetical protein